MTYHFQLSLPASKKLKWAFLSLSVVLLLCIGGYFLSEIFWDDYTYRAYSIRYGTEVTAGWPASLQGWSIWMGVAVIIVIPMMYFFQDWKNPQLGIMTEGLFINQQMIRNVTVPYSNIREIVKKDSQYEILFQDNAAVYSQVGFFFRPFVKYNLENGNFFIDDVHNGGDVSKFMEELSKKIRK
jgi:hypothetical protein